ncbi:protein TolB [Francisella tularensis]|uniref:Tol-Pal system protein TolB n=1 Tax=Francisella tularensis subsp. mediasiatica (strain FSC147) TaxID=441952 RepID=TOLB_FRATM|nr:protein TolB [Francisella tularensis]B2SET5.1 RecName: Full=Tol-Pal system protein TolB; Flags: Precursor [Francisella tularensis subsp. mediasiatica FSC147]ACD30461.1 group A colicin translocation; tolB protein [Francisella tularensis subsp. mediasiatica FSC147]MBK2077564.1 protein TolB [Francisella tularensis subsp. mediasiatica]MBK2102210.1 protein TolB [Francisella tularensis subsp. mediasiatica]MBK2104752.1 protein TolB [Francisella tularensis subsp. mediasiatica]MDN9002811.1 protein 
MRKIIAGVFIFVFLISNLYADLVAEVTTGVIQKPLVTVVSDNVVDQFPQQVNFVIVADLNHNAKLQANDTIKYEIKQKQNIPWKSLKSDYVVLTKYTNNSYNNYTVEVQILKRNDTSYLQAITYKNINVSLMRALAHKISNYVYQKLTGNQGFFLTKLAYVKVSNPYARYGRLYELIISDYDGYNKHVVLRQTDNPIATPSWSNDGRYIVYSSYSGGSMGVYTLEIATGKVTRITNYKGINSSPSFSPDGKEIALALSKGYSDQTNIYIMNLSTKALKRITINGINTAPKFSPNGQSIVFTSDREGRPNIYVASVNSKYPQSSILSTKIHQAYEPNYTPDGKNIVFMNQSSRTSGTQIADFNLANGSVTNITNGKADSSPTVSPYGDMVAYISTNTRGYSSLDMVSLDGDNHFNIETADNGNILIQSPSWSPKNF